MTTKQKTSTLDVYCAAISKSGRIKKLTREEEIKYFTALESLCSKDNLTEQEQHKKKTLINVITKSCLPYVIHLAQGYCKGKSDQVLLEELVAAGNVGLCRAVFKYKLDVGTPFYNYASNWIKAELRLALKGYQTIIRKPANTNNITTIWLEEMEKSPTEEDIKPDDMADLSSIEDLNYLIKKLPARQQIIFRLYTGLVTGKSVKFTQLGVLFGSDVAYIKQQYTLALATLHSLSKSLINCSAISETS